MSEGLTAHPARSDDVGSYEGFVASEAPLSLTANPGRFGAQAGKGSGYDIQRWRSAGDAVVAFVGSAARSLERAAMFMVNSTE